MKSFQKYTELASLVVLDASMMKPMLLTTTGQCPNFHAGTDDPYKLCERCGCFSHAIPDSYAIIPPSIKAHTSSAFCSSHPPSWACETWTLAQLLARLLRLSSAHRCATTPQLCYPASLLDGGTRYLPAASHQQIGQSWAYLFCQHKWCTFVRSFFFFLRHNALKSWNLFISKLTASHFTQGSLKNYKLPISKFQ